MEADDKLAPVAGWDLNLFRGHGAAAITLRYLVSEMESPDMAHPSPNFVLSVPQLRELAALLNRAADELESDGIQAPPGPKN